MANYRDPKVTTPTTQKRGGGMGRWIGIIIAAIIVVLLIAWWMGGSGEEAAVAPATTGEAPATEGTGTVPVAPADPAAPAAPAQQ